MTEFALLKRYGVRTMMGRFPRERALLLAGVSLEGLVVLKPRVEAEA